MKFILKYLVADVDVVDMTEVSLGVVVAVLCIIILTTVVVVVLLRRFVSTVSLSINSPNSTCHSTINNEFLPRTYVNG